MFLFGCNFKKEALGPINDLIVFTSKEDKEYVSFLINGHFNSKGRNCPQFEPFFNIKIKTSYDLDEFHFHRNLLLLSLENPIDTTMDTFLSKLNKSANNNNPIFSTNNLYAYDQVITSIKAKDAIHLQILLDTNFEWIHEQFMTELEENIWNDESSKDQNITIKSQIKDWFKLDIPISMDYIYVKKDSLKKFMWIGRVYPYRWITIHEIPINNKTKPNYYWEKFDSLISETMPVIEISEYYRTHDILKENNNKYLTGVYGHIESHTGGPFVSFIIENEQINKVQFITGFVNNPGKPKILMVKELELIFEHLKIIKN